MKKSIIAILALVLMLAIAAGACAESVSFRFSTPCQAIADSQLYNYHDDGDGALKRGSSNMVHVRHTVVQNDADETNRIAAYKVIEGKTMGANWHPSDNGQYPCTSNAIVSGKRYTVAGRGNTNYASKYGLNTITLTGTCYSDLD